MSKIKYAWHIHHKILFERITGELGGEDCSGDLDERREYIKTHKPPCEIERRLRLLKPIAGSLPVGIIRAEEEFDLAWDAYVANSRANPTGINIAQRKLELAIYAARHEMDALHVQECPDCPWNGQTLFSVFENYDALIAA